MCIRDREALEGLLAQIGDYAQVERLPEYEKSVPLFIAAHRSQEEDLRDALRSAGFTDAGLSLSGLVKEEIARLRQESQRLAQERDRVQAQALELAVATMTQLQIAFDKYSLLVQREEAGESIRVTGRAFLITGWIRQRDGEKLRELLYAECPDLMIEDVEPEEGEVPPTAVRNSRLLRPFEAVTAVSYTHLSDHRINLTLYKLPAFMDGDLDEMIDALIMEERTALLAASGEQ